MAKYGGGEDTSEARNDKYLKQYVGQSEPPRGILSSDFFDGKASHDDGGGTMGTTKADPKFGSK